MDSGAGPAVSPLDATYVIEATKGRWGRVLATAMAGLAVGVALAYLIPPTYRASVALAPVPPGHGLSGGAPQLGPLAGFASLAGLGGDPQKETNPEEAVAVVKSREFVQRFIADKQLVQKLFPGNWDARANAWKVPANRVPSLARAYKLFSERVLFVAKDRKSGLFVLQVSWRDPDEAAAWANELVDRLNAEMRARALAEADARLAYLERERDTTRLVGVRDAINRLIDTELKQRVVATVDTQYAFRPIDRARPPERDERVSPDRPMLIVCGLLAGTLLGVAFAVFGRVRAGLAARDRP